MSAFVVDTSTMTRAVTALLAKHHGSSIFGRVGMTHTDERNAGTEIGRAMFALNIDAVKQAYPRDSAMWSCTDAETFKYRNDDFRPTTQAQLIDGYKALRCVVYQCSEGNVPQSDLYQALEEASHVIADIIVSETPEYKKAAW